MKNVQMNTRVPEDIKNWIDEQAKKIDRDRGYYLNKLIRPMMEGAETTQRVNLANPEETGSKANQEPVTNKHKTVTSNQEPKEPKEPNAPKAAWTPPEGLNLEAWADYEQHRKTTKGKFTDLARTKAANVIKDLSHAEQQATIDKSIQSGWPGLFPDKSKKSASQDLSAQIYKEGAF